MKLPDDVKFATRCEDGSEMLVFEEKTAWVLSTCPTCMHQTLMEILQKDGKVIGVRFVKSEAEKLPPIVLEQLQESRAKAARDWSECWTGYESIDS